MNPVAVLRTIRPSGSGVVAWQHLLIWCPGCDKVHAVNVEGSDGYRPTPCWDWDGNLDAPTISPSILCHSSVYLHDDGTQCPDWADDYETKTHTQGPCHSFVKACQWQFLSDCAHMLADQTVPMVPLPDWLLK